MPVDQYVNNLVGAFALAVSDALSGALTEAVGHSGALAAAVSYLLQEPDCGIEELRGPLGLSQPAAVRLVNQLVDGGLASRSGDTRDGRRVRIRLTHAGRRLAQSLLRSRREAIDAVISSLAADERRTLAVILSKMLGSMTDDRAHAERLCRLCDVRACPQETCPVEASVVQ